MHGKFNTTYSSYRSVPLRGQMILPNSYTDNKLVID